MLRFTQSFLFDAKSAAEAYGRLKQERFDLGQRW
jgi:hypothetical protein